MRGRGGGGGGGRWRWRWMATDRRRPRSGCRRILFRFFLYPFSRLSRLRCVRVDRELHVFVCVCVSRIG